MVEDGVEHGSRGCALKGQRPGGHFVEHNAKGEEIGAAVEFFAEGLFWRHVGDGAQSRAGDGVLGVSVRQGGGFIDVLGSFGRSQLGDAEIKNFGVTAVGEKNI